MRPASRAVEALVGNGIMTTPAGSTCRSTLSSPLARFLSLCGAALIAAELSSHVLRADEDVESSAATQAFYRDLKLRHQKWSTFEYECSGTAFEPRGCMTMDAASLGDYPPTVQGPLPPEDQLYQTSLQVAADLQNCRMKQTKDRLSYFPEVGKYVPEFRTMLFDGENSQCYSPRERNTGKGYTPPRYQPDLHLDGRTTGQRFVHWLEWPILAAHGLLPGFRMIEPASLSSPDYPRIDLFQFLGTTDFQGDECRILSLETSVQTGGSLQFWINPDKQSAVRRIAWLSGADEVAHMDIYYEEVDGWWLPTQWKWMGLDRQFDQPPFEEYRVTKRRLGRAMDVSEFRIEPKPGMVIDDQVQKKRYVKGGFLTPDRLVEKKRPSPSGSGFARLGLWANQFFLFVSAILGIGIVYCLLKQKHSRFAASSRQSATN